MFVLAGIIVLHISTIILLLVATIDNVRGPYCHVFPSLFPLRAQKGQQEAPTYSYECKHSSSRQAGGHVCKPLSYKCQNMLQPPTDLHSSALRIIQNTQKNIDPPTPIYVHMTRVNASALLLLRPGGSLRLCRQTCGAHGG